LLTAKKRTNYCMNNLRVCGDSVAIKVSTETCFRHGAEEGSGE
jgi:hypothetical protein